MLAMKNSCYLRDIIFWEANPCGPDNTDSNASGSLDRAALCVKEFFQTSSVHQNEVDLVVLATQAFTSDGPLKQAHNIIMDNHYNVKFNQRVLFENGLVNIQLHGCYTLVSGDWLSALRIARNFSFSENLNNILVIVIDDPYEDDESQSSDMHIAVFCISQESIKGWQLVDLKQYEIDDDIPPELTANVDKQFALGQTGMEQCKIHHFLLDTGNSFIHPGENGILLREGNLLSSLRALTESNTTSRSVTQVSHRCYSQMTIASFLNIS